MVWGIGFWNETLKKEEFSFFCTKWPEHDRGPPPLLSYAGTKLDNSGGNLGL